jgi:LIVCS family branched-chain amino acid:cation transporter
MSIESSSYTQKSGTLRETLIIITTGMALFAMFFGAGNIVFPLHLGANAGQNISYAAIGFLLAGVGVPFLGLLATSLYQGDYEAFFNRLGKWPGFLLITFLMVIIGPLAAMPRTEVTTFYALQPYLPEFLKNNAILSALYCSIVFLLGYRENKIVTILGLVLSPVKIISFSILVGMGLLFAEPPLVSPHTALQSFSQAIKQGYSTMDLLAAFFYCSVAFRSIKLASQQNPDFNTTRLTLKACMLGAIITGVVYMGFMVLAHSHSSALQGLNEEHMISAISSAVLGKWGGLFVCVAVSVACLATALALAEVSMNYLYQEIFKKKITKTKCLFMVILTTYFMSNLGFQGIMAIAMPILNIIYPALIVLCIMNILHKWKGVELVKFPVLITLFISTIIVFMNP